MKLLSRKEVAERLGRKPRWVTERLVKPRLLTVVKMGGSHWMVRESDLEKLMEKMAHKGKVA